MSDKLQHEEARWPIAEHLSAKWHPRAGGRPPTEPPNPHFPNGCDVDMTDGEHGCATKLPYVHNRIGLYVVECAICGLRVALTVAGRPDDALLAKVPCKPLNQAAN